MLKGYTSIRSGNSTLTECFKNYQVIREKFNTLWQNLADIDTFMSIRNPTREENEKGAKESEKWCEIFPVFFPEKNLTRKMVEISLVMPKFIRKQPGLLNTILRLEQEGEHLHQIFNTLAVYFIFRDGRRRAARPLGLAGGQFKTTYDAAMQ